MKFDPMEQIKEQTYAFLPGLNDRTCLTSPALLLLSPQVYDVTPFMEEHPGGDEVLLACVGNYFQFPER